MKKRIHSFQHAIKGISLVFKSEKNMQIHFLFAVLVILFGFLFEITIIEWMFCLLSIGSVLGAEMINTAIENLVDLASPKRHALAGKAKDVAAGAVLVSAFFAAVVGLIIFAPKVWAFLMVIIH